MKIYTEKQENSLRAVHRLRFPLSVYATCSVALPQYTEQLCGHRVSTFMNNLPDNDQVVGSSPSVDIQKQSSIDVNLCGHRVVVDPLWCTML